MEVAVSFSFFFSAKNAKLEPLSHLCTRHRVSLTAKASQNQLQKWANGPMVADST
jgi:hypothetical protein